MRKFTKKQRHEIYKKALSHLPYIKREFPHHGLCSVFEDIRRKHDLRITPYDTKGFGLPELDLFFDLRCAYPFRHEYSFDLAWNQREQILMFCIEMTK